MSGTKLVREETQCQESKRSREKVMKGTASIRGETAHHGEQVNGEDKRCGSKREEGWGRKNTATRILKTVRNVITVRVEKFRNGHVEL